MTTITNNIDIKVISKLVDEMVRMGIYNIIPIQESGVMHNKDIQEIIIDEEGTVFVLFAESLEDPIMLPMFVTVA